MLNHTHYIAIVEKLQINRKWFLILGIFLVIGGLLALSNLYAATVFSMYLLGGFILASGIIQLFQSFYTKQTGLFFITLSWSIIYILAGLYILTVPIQASIFLTVFLGIVLLIFGVSRLVSSFMLRNMAGNSWLILTGVFDLLFGLLIISGWPSNSLILFGVFLGVDLLMQGICFIMIYISIKQASIKA